MIWKLLALAFLLLAAFLWLGIGALRRARFRKRIEKAKRTFSRSHGDLEGLFLATASQSGKPRGLVWKQCELSREPLFARDLVTSEIYALAGATISFEAIKGGDMEEVEAVGNLRSATAIFRFQKGKWTTEGRALFNLEPREAVERYAESLEPLTIQDRE